MPTRDTMRAASSCIGIVTGDGCAPSPNSGARGCGECGQENGTEADCGRWCQSPTLSSMASDISFAQGPLGNPIAGKTNGLRHALILAEQDGLSGAILDHALGNDDSSLLYARLKERGIPFMVYSGFYTRGGVCEGVLHIGKPAASGQLVAAMENLILG